MHVVMYGMVLIIFLVCLKSTLDNNGKNKTRWSQPTALAFLLSSGEREQDPS